MPNQRLHAIVSGHVQGVGFRYFVVENAEILHLKGWVRNLVDGEVEVLAEGNHFDLERLAALLETGPTGSHVINLTLDWQPAENTFTRFSIRPTA
jgi:acylphosphatase